jgi:hypothetical protein
MISIKSGELSHNAFFEQRRKFNIIFLDTSNGTKMIELHKGGNIKSIIMKKLLNMGKSYLILACLHKTQ